MHSESQYTSFGKLIFGLKAFKSGVVVLLLLQVAGMFIELVIPFITRALVDQGINNQDIEFIYLVVLSLFVLTMGNIITNLFKGWLMRHIGVRMNMNLLNVFMQRLLTKSVLFFAKKSSGEIIQLVNDNLRVEKFFTYSISFLLELFLKLIAFGIVLFIFDVTIGTVYFISILIGFGWDVMFLKAREKQDIRKFNASSRVRADIVETVDGVNDIKVNKLEEHRMSNWRVVQNFLAQTSLKMLHIHN
ncbi:MAG: ABC transporter transmembrane domain-containing protein, partial [Bacteroidota bacterium]